MPFDASVSTEAITATTRYTEGPTGTESNGDVKEAPAALIGKDDGRHSMRGKRTCSRETRRGGSPSNIAGLPGPLGKGVS
jgi:hypothetical protein